MNAAGPLVRLSLQRFASRPMRTALSVIAVAAGVAFVFAIQVINFSPEASYRELERAVGGQVDLYMVARSQDGVPDAVFKRIAALPEVAAAAPMSQQLVRIYGSGGSARVGLIGVDQRLRAFHPPAAGSRLLSSNDESAIGVYLPPQVARQLNVGVGDRVSVRYGARIRTSLVAGVFSGRTAGALKDVSVALVPLGLAQSLTGTNGRITRILLKLHSEPTPATIETLSKASGGMLDVTRKGSDAKLLASVSAIESQAASLFATLTLLIGALLVYNVAAMSALERRRDVSVLRTIGASRRVILAHTIAESFVIGIVGSVLGVVLGRLLLTAIAGSGPQYLSSAFLINASVIVPVCLVALAIAAGTLVAIAGGAIPTALDLRTRDIAAAETGVSMARSHGSRGRHMRVGMAIALLITGTAIALAAPANDSLGIALMIVGGGLLMPTIVHSSIRFAYRALPRPGGARQLGIAELRAFPSRATALASICAMCLSTLVLVGGTVNNFQSGMATLGTTVFSAGDLWISIAGPENNLGTESFNADDLSAVRGIPGVRDLRGYPLTFMDFKDRRLLVLGYAPGVTRVLSSNEFVGGNRRALSQGLPRDGDVALSKALAKTAGLRLGQSFMLPTPTGLKHVRYVATISNYGWQAGAITMGAKFFARAWGSSKVSMLGVRVAPGANVGTVAKRLHNFLGAGTPFRIETQAQGKARGNHNVDVGTARLRQIALAVLVGTILAVTASSLAAIAQRRRRLASLRAIVMSPSQTCTSLLVEIGFVLMLGAVVGVVLGLAAQVLIVLTFSSAGYPIKFAPSAGPFLWAVAAIALIAIVSTVFSTRQALRKSIVEDLSFE